MQYVMSTKVLGLIITSMLSWTKYVSGISQRVQRTLRLLRYHKKSLSFLLKKRLGETLMFSIFNYAAVACLALPDRKDFNACKTPVSVTSTVTFLEWRM